MKMQWIDYSEDLWHRQPLPPERRKVLVQVAAREDGYRPPSVAVGYMKFAAGCKDSPRFIVPGVGGTVVAWCDCLGDDFFAPLWPGTHAPNACAGGEG